MTAGGSRSPTDELRAWPLAPTSESHPWDPPQADRLVVARVSEDARVGAERHGVDEAMVAAERQAELGATPHVPEARRPVVAGGRKDASIGTEHRAANG